MNGYYTLTQANTPPFVAHDSRYFTETEATNLFINHAGDTMTGNLLFNNDIDNSSGLGVGTDKNYIDTSEGKLVDGKQEVAQYVRLYSNENNLNDRSHYLEVEVYGRTPK